MPTERIGDLPKRVRPCAHPDHEPPKHMVYRSGRYKHTCSGCGAVMFFTVGSYAPFSCERKV